MLVFANVALIEAIYDSTKKIYPELVDTPIVIDYIENNAGVLLLEGMDEDAGKYKIAISTSDDEKVIASFFISGLALLIYKLKYGKNVHPLSNDKEFQINDDYKEILKNITKAFENVLYKGEYTHE